MKIPQEDLLIHGDSVYDIIDKQDHGSIQAELSRSVPQQTASSGSHHHSSSLNSNSLDGEHRMFLCRMNVSRNARRQMRFGDQKVSKHCSAIDHPAFCMGFIVKSFCIKFCCVHVFKWVGVR